MPQVSGFDVLTALADHEIRIPAIVVTADVTAQAAARAKSLGAVACLAKPVAEEQLLDALSGVLQPT